MQKTTKRREREIPFNYTSADDDQIISHLFGTEILTKLEQLRTRRVTGRSARLLFRFMGDLFIMERNAFIFQSLIDHPVRRNHFFSSSHQDLTAIEQGARDTEVADVIMECRQALDRLSKRIKAVDSGQKRLIKRLAPIIGRESIYTDPFNLTAHATDATDWRLFPPVAVVRPCEEYQVPLLVRAIRDLGFHIIPRGGGTGLTGGSVPLTQTCVIINTEKLNRIQGIRTITSGTGVPFPVIQVEAGVITDHAMAHAKKEGLVFATDPTSSWASTIGGNIAENAGGKTAVLWGTALDNLFSYTMVMPDGQMVTVIRQNHPLRKIEPLDEVIFELRDADNTLIREIRLAGSDIRKQGLGKDVTNKALNGLPGIQKEGCDGIITSASFILHPEFPIKQTFCLEFFGQDLTEAGKVIADISSAFANAADCATLIALEHFDEEYIKAIDYKAKAAGSGRLKAVLLLDMVARSTEQLAGGSLKLETILKRYARTELTAARDDREAERFWRDRKRLGAIAKRTNAFKLNEDIVLPISALAEFADYVDRYNLEEKRHNQLSLITTISSYLESAEPLEDPEWLVAKVTRARQMSLETRGLVQTATRDELDSGVHADSFVKSVLELLRGYSLVTETIRNIVQETESRLIVIATHMHAGDGNVHVNIPVLSNDRKMMRRAARTADAIMVKAVDLGGAVSGEHGIGITKFKHLSPERVQALETYRNSVDPGRIMNPGKLCDADIIDKVFTPSFNLLELEASILRHGSLGTLASSIANCVRCGRCKVSCPVFYPHKDLFFHPRNKNLGVGALIEALLYDTQRTHSTRFRALSHLEQIADHCTICHKCHVQCPVGIDTGEVSILERKILNERNFKHTSFPTRVSLAYLSSRNDAVNAGMRSLLLQLGTRAQRTVTRLLSTLPVPGGLKQSRRLQRFQSPMATIPATTMRSILPRCGHNQAILAEPDTAATRTVFYFPGCGSERLFSDIGKASLYLLLKHGVRVILPPPFLCCGFPARANADAEQSGMLFLRNTIIFSQIRGMFNDLRFDAAVISCGTCQEALVGLNTGGIFDCRVVDITRFVLGINPDLKLTRSCLYHAPCHDSLNGDGQALLSERTQETVTSVPHCCSEAGTMAISRPAISNAMLERKQNALISARKIPGDNTVILTNCPSCIQGLSRNAGSGIRPVHIAVELAEIIGGPGWEKELVETLQHCDMISF